jgi:soluble lytic murein transglycosylase
VPRRRNHVHSSLRVSKIGPRQRGDPRDPKVDPVDWVERIPFMETRNYVQRVMENLQVYRTLLGGNARLTIETDLRQGVATN